MGLGKTIQSITFLHEVFLTGVRGPFLVIAPLSTIPNWEREFRTWTQHNVIVYHGSQASRKTIQAYEMYYRDPQVGAHPLRVCGCVWGSVVSLGSGGAEVQTGPCGGVQELPVVICNPPPPAG